MFTRFIFVIAMTCAMALTTGCAVNSATANLSPGTDLSSFKSIYVVKQPKDKAGLDSLIAQDLKKRGYAVTQGPELTTPYNADVAVTYVDRWMWDITLYLLDLTVNFRDAKSGFPVAVGNSHHTSLTRKSPPEMVSEVMTNIFAAPKK
jgi:hypothetical protein